MHCTVSQVDECEVQICTNTGRQDSFQCQNEVHVSHCGAPIKTPLMVMEERQRQARRQGVRSREVLGVREESGYMGDFCTLMKVD